MDWLLDIYQVDKYRDKTDGWRDGWMNGWTVKQRETTTAFWD